jgi:hypothetical protein
MRCTRCDGFTIPQATGRTPDDRFVFGWCLTCLKETGCLDIQLAHPPRKHLSRVLEPSGLVDPSLPALRERSTPDRRRLLSIWSLLLSLWGFILLFGGLLMRPRVANTPTSPLGNGSPPLLVFGGGATAAVGLSLWLVATRGGVLGSRSGLKTVQLLAFLVAMATLATGIVIHTPKRDPLVVALASLAVGVSLAARWFEVKRFRPARVFRND